MTPRRYASMYERLVAHTAEPVSDNGCWEHDGTCNNKSGYPTVNVWENGKVRHIYAFKAMWECVYGSVTPGYQIDHICQNVKCVNPDHLLAMPGRLNRQLVNIRAERKEHHMVNIYRVLHTVAMSAAAALVGCTSISVQTTGDVTVNSTAKTSISSAVEPGGVTETSAPTSQTRSQ